MKVANIPKVEEKTIYDANILHVVAGTNGYKGGDGGHGGATYFAIADQSGGGSFEFAVRDDGHTVTVEAFGDAELRTLIAALQFGAETLRSQARRSTDLPEKVENQIHVVSRELQELSDAAWHARESKSGAQRLREIAARIVLSSKHLESLVRDQTFPIA